MISTDDGYPINQSSNDANETTSLLNDGSVRVNSTSQNTSQREQSGVSWYFAVFLIVNAALGAGLLNFSKAFDEAGGILVSSIMHCVSKN